MLRRAEVVALVTAAGASSRMGTPKALLDWGGQPLVAHQAEALAGFAEVVVVLGAAREAIRAAAPLTSPARYVDNPAWAEGRSTSVEAGARALGAAARAVLVVAVDQPLEAAVVDALLAAFDPEAHAVAQPVRGGRRGHPLLLAASALPALRRASERPEGLRDVVRDLRARAIEVEVASDGVHHDLNTPERYAAAVAVAAAGGVGVTEEGG